MTYKPDPLEKNNLGGDLKYADALKALRETLQRGIEATDDPIHLGPIRPLEGAKVISAKSWNPEEGVTDQFDP